MIGEDLAHPTSSPCHNQCSLTQPTNQPVEMMPMSLLLYRRHPRLIEDPMTMHRRQSPDVMDGKHLPQSPFRPPHGNDC